MSWAARRRFLILFIIGAVVTAFLTILSISVFYETPSCTDDKQNQDESGVDCGGGCTKLCIAEQEPPTVLFTKALANRAGRIDVIASVENKNPTAAAKNIPYRVLLYGSNQILVQEVTGTVDLSPGATVPVFIPGINSGQQSVVNAFLTIATSSPEWYTLGVDPRIVPSVLSITQGGSTIAPRIEAVLTNGSVTALADVKVIVLVRDVQKEVIGASQTIVSTIGAQSTAKAMFIWNTPFAGVPASIEVVPIIPLP